MNWKAVVWPLGICALVQAHAYGVVLLEGSVKDAFHCPCNRIVLEISQIKNLHPFEHLHTGGKLKEKKVSVIYL